MGLPRIVIGLTNGALANKADTSDGVAGLICSGVATSDMPLFVPRKFVTLRQVEQAGITAYYDATNLMVVWQQCKHFFAAGGTELWLMIVPPTINTEMMATLYGSPANVAVRVLLEHPDVKGRIRICGLVHWGGNMYSPPTSTGFDDFTYSSIAKLQAIGEGESGGFMPVRFVVYAGKIGASTQPAYTKRDMRTMNANRVAVVPLHAEGVPAIGLLLGKLSAVPVQRKAGRVKDGALPVVTMTMSDGYALEKYDLDTMVDKGYVVARGFVGRTGYWFANDPTCTSLDDDYNSLSRGRVIDKAVMVAYNTYLEELLDEVAVTDEGKLKSAVLACLKGIIEEALRQKMVVRNEITSAAVDIDEEQQVLLTNMLEMQVRLVPVGYLEEIVVSLGFKDIL